MSYEADLTPTGTMAYISQRLASGKFQAGQRATCGGCSKVFYHPAGENAVEPTCESCTGNRVRFALKAAAVEYKGGQCVGCGYRRCLRALTFHHVDPTEKEFSIATMQCAAWETIKKEIDKCVLLCENCHREYHDDVEWLKWHETGRFDIIDKVAEAHKNFQPPNVDYSREDWKTHHPRFRPEQSTITSK